MRNLKKLFAVLLTVAMLASIMVPALAAEGFKYETEAEQLYDLGLFKGVSDTEYKPELETVLTRETGLVLVIRAMGMEEEVLAMTAEEIAAQLAKVEDLDTIYDWAHPYVAYALKTGLTNGIGGAAAGMVKYAGQLELTGKEFVNFMLKGLGYNMNDKWDEVATEAATAGLPVALSVNYGANNAAINRDVAVGLIDGFMAAKNSAGVTMAQALVDAGAVDAEKMAEYGYFTPTVAPTEAPEELEIVASTDNLIQIYLTFNSDLDKESAEDEDNYEIDDVKISNASLQDDGRTVILTLAYASAKGQQGVVDVTVDGVKDADGTTLDEYTVEDIEFLDTTIPTAVDATVVGNDTFKVIFSEPMKGTDPADDTKGVSYLNKNDFEVNGGKSYVKQVRLQNNNTEALVEMYSDLKEGDVSVKVKSGSEDFAGFGVTVKTFTLEVVPDEEAPVVIGYEEATQQKVTLIWNEDVEQNCSDAKIGDFFYHTNSKNKAVKLTVDGNKTTLDFGGSDDNWLPEGTAYVYVDEEGVNDLWDNENDQQMIKVEVEVDSTLPEVKEVDVSYDKTLESYKLKITYTEDVKSASADEDNYTILDNEGDEIEGIIDDTEWDEDDADVVTIIFENGEDLNGDYSVVIEDVKDNSNNEIATVSVPFTVGDEIAPDPNDFVATVFDRKNKDQMVKINFKDVMATEGNYSVDDVEKYVVVENTGSVEEPIWTKVIKKLEDIDDVKINVVDDGKAVEIFIPSSEDVDKASDPHVDIELKYGIKIARVADAAGNKMDGLTTVVPFEEADFIGLDGMPKATATDTIKVTLADEVDFEVEDFVLSTTSDTVTSEVYALEYAEVDYTINKDGNTEITFTVADDDKLDPDLKVKPIYLHIVPTVDTVGDDDPDVTASENKYGNTLKIDIYAVLDGIAPEVAKDANDDLMIDFEKGATDSTIEITFTEALNDTDEELYAHDLIVKDDDGDALKAGRDFTTKVSDTDSKVLIVTVLGVTDLEDYSIESKDSITFIEDAAEDKDGNPDGNAAKAFDKVKNN